MRIFTKLAASAFFLVWAHQGFSQTQVVNLNTGINPNNSLITQYTTPDPKWTVKLPNTTTYIAAHRGSGDLWHQQLGNLGSYLGKDPSVGWICPQQFLLPTGEHIDAPAGNYDYRLQFESTGCGPLSAQFNFNHIGGDNEITDIFVNGNQYSSPNYSFANWFSGVLSINAGDITPGTNTIIVRLSNTGSWMGMEINGSLNILYTSTQNAGTPPAVSYSNGTLNGSSAENGSHYWEVYCAPNATTGPYSLVASFNTPSFSFTGNCGCYYVRHTLNNDCGTFCTAQTICEADCELDECSISAPTGLQVTHLSSFQSQFTWNPVLGAVSYILEINPNDPACCGGDQMFATPPFVFPVMLGPDTTIDFGQILWPSGTGSGGGEIINRCYSWRVRAVCANGSMSNYSQSMCSNPGGGEPWQRPAKTGSSMTEDSGSEALQAPSTSGGGINAAEAVIFPNPAKESVEIYVRGLQSETINMQILDVSGKVVKTIKNLRTENGKITKQLNVESFDKGTYLIQISSDGSTVMTERLVVE